MPTAAASPTAANRPTARAAAAAAARRRAACPCAAAAAAATPKGAPQFAFCLASRRPTETRASLPATNRTSPTDSLVRHVRACE